MRMKEVGFEDLKGVTVSDRRFDKGALTLIPAEGEEMVVVCACGRHHWLVTTYREGKTTFLKLVCHSCQRQTKLPFSGP